MIFTIYFLRRFTGFFFTLTLLLAAIFNLIEFFEKLVRVANVDVQTVFHFICLNFLPSFSDLMPVGSWLATCLLLWEFHQRHEWDTLFMLSIGYKQLFTLFAWGGFLVMVTAFVVHEGIVLPLTVQSARFKRERFHYGGQKNKLINKSFMIKNDLFCSIGLLDVDAGVGHDLLLVYLSDHFEIERVVSAPLFYMNPAEKMVMLDNGQIFTKKDQQMRQFQHEKITIPGLFVKLWMHDEAPLLINLIKMVILQRMFLSREIVNELFYLILQRLMFYFQIVIYPVATFSLFLLGGNHLFLRWLMLLIPYPLITVISVLIMLLYQNSVSASVLMLLYVGFMLLMGGLGSVLWRRKIG